MSDKQEQPIFEPNEDLIKSFTEQYIPSYIEDVDADILTFPMLRERFFAFPDFASGLDPLTSYLDRLSYENFRLSHDHEGNPCLFVRPRT